MQASKFNVHRYQSNEGLTPCMGILYGDGDRTPEGLCLWQTSLFEPKRCIALRGAEQYLEVNSIWYDVQLEWWTRDFQGYTMHWCNLPRKKVPTVDSGTLLLTLASAGSCCRQPLARF